MCIEHYVEHPDCGHAENHYYNKHCKCPLIVGPVEQADGPCLGCRTVPGSDPTAVPLTIPDVLPPTPPEAEADVAALLHQREEEQSGGTIRQTDNTLYDALWGRR